MLFALFFLNNSAKSQSNDWCHTHSASEQAMNESKTYRDNFTKLQNDIANFKGGTSNKNGATITYTIPVVVHIVHENGSENIPSANVHNMIEILNRDYQKLNADTSTVAPAFQGIIGDMEIQFRLATKDPNGNCTNGIVRLFDPAFTNSGGCNSSGCSIPKPGTWPSDKYLNIYVVKDIASGAGAYAFFPGVPSSIDGIVCRYNQFGSLPPSNSGNFAARTMPHEVGHWLSLYHPWGGSNTPGVPSNCNIDDFVGDTPNTIGVTGQNCNLSQTTCGSLDNVQNIMDYSNCAVMFTAGQVARVHATLNSSVGGRNNLWTPANLIATGTDDASYQNPACPPTADFFVNKNKECEGGSFSFADRSHHAIADPNTFIYNWTFNGGTPANSSMKNPTAIYNTAGLYDVTLDISLPGTSSDVFTRTDLIEITPGSGSYIAPYVEQINDVMWPNNTDISLNWSRAKPAGSLFQFQRSSNGYYSPPASIYLNNFSFNNNGQFELISPVADLTNMQAGSTFLNFQVAHAQKGTEQEGISLWVSTDCGESFVFNKAWGGIQINSVPASSSAFIPADTSEWRFISHDISSLAGLDNIQFKLRFTASSGNNIWLDDIHISDSDQPVAQPVGFKQELFGDFNLYPNPNEGVFTLEFNVSGNDKVEAEIVDMIGKSTPIEFSETINSGWNTASVDTRNYNLKPGIYFLKLESGDQVFSKRLIIQ